jgi:Zn-dependent peptidase ImmA (M78 family)
MKDELTKEEIEDLKRKAREKLGECRKGNDIIGSQVFSILSLYARVIYYPLGKDAPWGFTRISGTRNDVCLDKPFAAINTSLSIDCQVFAAAHELYHIWFEQKPDIISSNLLFDHTGDPNEMKANRFSAEFLVDEFLLKQEIDLYKIREYSIKSVLQLAGLFEVPYRTMAKRLKEIGAIGTKERDKLLSETEDSIRIYRRKFALPQNEPTNRISLDNLNELAVNIFEKGGITFEKLEYLLSLSKLQPADLGIVKTSDGNAAADDELDSIIEE